MEPSLTTTTRGLQSWLRRYTRRYASFAVDTLAARSSHDSVLITAARRGDTELAESLIRNGAALDARNWRGETALHCAVKYGNPLVAACLLHYGADRSIPDTRGRTPLSLDYTDLETLHSIRQRHRRFRPRQAARQTLSSAQVEGWLDELNEHGFLRLPRLVVGDELARMQGEFARFAENMEAKLARGEGKKRHYDEEEHWWKKDRAYICNNAFKYSPQLARLCSRDEIIETVNLYFGRTTWITRAVAMRYLPQPDFKRENDMFGWHHDMEEKRLKLQILLTDVGPRDQHMSYVAGSQKIYHPLRMFQENPCGLDYCRKHLRRIEIREGIGDAGDAFLFDSNGAHRGNRRPDGRIRDVFFVEFCSDASDVWGGDLDRDLLSATDLPMGNPFEQMLAAEKKWRAPVTRETTPWVEDLPLVEKWA